jgi:alpha-beta hydrolase superfamily lysophospholipase
MLRESLKACIKAMLILFTCLVIALVLLYVFQRRLIYFPTRVSHAQWADEVRTIFGPKVSVLAPYDALVIEPNAGTPVVGTAVWFHGNAGLALDRATFVPVFIARGLRLILAEYPGYGARSGVPTESALVADASALYETVVQRYGHQPLVLVGESLGGGVAVQVAARSPRPPSRLILLTPFLSVTETAARVYWFLPAARYLVRDRFDSVGQLSNYAGPIAILVAGRDQVVGASQGRELVERARARGEVICVELAEAGHSSWPALLSEDQWNQLLGLPALPTSAKEFASA